MKRQENTIIDVARQCMRCTTCGDEVPFPLGEVSYVCAVMRAFIKAHKDCDGRGERTLATVPKPRAESGPVESRLEAGIRAARLESQASTAAVEKSP